jgi:hypothetical protein
VISQIYSFILKVLLVATAMIALLMGAKATAADGESPVFDTIGREQKISTMTIKDIGMFEGQYLTVLYVKGYSPALGFDIADELRISVIKDAQRDIKIESDTVTIPETSFRKYPDSYNFIVLVVHPEPGFYWLNPPGTAPIRKGQFENGNSPFKTMTTLISKKEYQEALSSQESLTFSFLKN